MLFKIGGYIRQWLFRLLFGGLIFGLYLSVSPELVLASVHTYPEAPGQVMYRSLQSLRDSSDNAWQAVLFKRIELGHVDSLHLRIVGFPGVTELAHPKPLRITAKTGEVWTAADVFVESSLPANVGEYDLLNVMAQLDKDTSLRLSLPLKDEHVVNLLVPPFVVREWRRVFDIN